MRRTILYSSLFILLLCTCKKESLFDCVKGSGELEKEERAIDDFTQVEINDIFNIYLSQDTSSKLIVEGGENLLSNIETTSKEGVLSIDDNNTCRWSRDYDRINIWLTVVHLEKINLFQPCFIQSLDTLRGNQLAIYALAGMNEGNLMLDYESINFVSSHTAGGKMILSGNTESIRIECYNSLHLDARNLKANRVDALNKSIGDIYIHCNEELEARIYNSGNIYYKGNPIMITVEMEGRGKLIPIEK